MTGHDDDVSGELHQKWLAGTATELELFVALRDPMRRGARRGLRRILSEQPDEYDVDEAVERAFIQLMEKGASEVQPPLRGFASAVAYNRGRDRARALVRKRERIKDAAWQADMVMPTGTEAEDHERRDRLLDRLPGCIDSLPELQREMIEAVYVRLMPLSDWTTERGKSYESGRRLRIRALKALRTCLEAAAPGQKEESDERAE